MKSSRLASLITLSGIAIVLASVLVFLYLKSIGDQSTSYTESRDLIRQIKQLNSQWDVEVLKARIALTHNYDPLVAPLKDMSERWVQLENREGQHHHEHPADWLARLRADDLFRPHRQSPLFTYCFELTRDARRTARDLPRLAYPGRSEAIRERLSGQ